MRLHYSEERADFEEYQEHMREQSRIIDENFADLAYHRSMKSIAVAVSQESKRNTQDYVERNYQRFMSKLGCDELTARKEAETEYNRSN